jgi:hypothetical protein
MLLYLPRRSLSLQISSGLGISNDRELRDALHKDDVDIARLLKSILISDGSKKAVLRLKDESAQNCVDLIQDVGNLLF